MVWLSVVKFLLGVLEIFLDWFYDVEVVGFIIPLNKEVFYGKG